MVPTPLQPYLGSGSQASLLLYGGLAAAGLFLILFLIGLWLIFGRGPRRSRAFHRARRVLQQGEWQQALNAVKAIQSEGRLSLSWQGRLRNLEGECHHKAADVALREKRYEDAVSHFDQAAACLDLEARALRERVLEAMLGESRRLFAQECGGQRLTAGSPAADLLARVLLIQSPCPEATFWLALCQLRDGRVDQAIASLNTAHSSGQRFIDPPLYLGAVLLREGRPQEALRYLSEANRDAANCPLVTWQLGMAMVAAGGDQKIAVKALDRALGTRGLGLWSGRRPSPNEGTAQPVWVEGMPEARSFVRRLALKHPYRCPVMGGDLGAMIRQGQLTLAQAHYRLGNFQESANLYEGLLKDSPPTPILLRGLGISLTRLEKYDQAYKHLRIALEQENPKDSMTAAYLALCAAMGKPAQADDRPRNVGWGIRVLAKYPALESAEWAQIASRIYTEARTLNMAVGEEDQVRLCQALATASIADPAAGAAFDHLAASFPEAVRSQFAWLYCRSAQAHGIQGQKDVELFSRTFGEEAPARDFFARRKWDFDDLEFTYLERWAGHHPGTFPPELGADGPARSESRLMARSRSLEELGQANDALGCVDVLLKLSPRNAAAHDRLAQLAWRRGDLDRAVQVLESWHSLEPTNPWPLVRQAIIEQQRSAAAASAGAIRMALEVTRGAERAGVAFLGAKLVLRGARGAENSITPRPALEEAVRLLEECLRNDPDHTEALWHLAAVRVLLDDRSALVAQAASMNRPAVKDARFHYFAAYCHLLAGDHPRTLQAGQWAAELASSSDPVLAADSRYLVGRAQIELRQPEAAQTLGRVVEVSGCASADAAWAVLGRLAFNSRDAETAVRWWGRVEATQRGKWKVDESLRGAVYVAGLESYGHGDFEAAAEKFREAGKLGLRERRLGSLITLALFKAGQRLLYGE